MVNILVVTYNNESEIKRLVATIFDCTKDFRLFIWDNASADKTPDWLDESLGECPNARVYKSPVNLGFTAGMNRLLDIFLQSERDLDGDVLPINPDTWVTEGWLDNIRRVAEEVKDVGIISPRLMTGKHDDAIWERTSLTWPGITWHQRKYVEMAWACFACVWIRRECLEQTGYLDEKCWHYGSDEWFGRKARSLGWRILYTQGSAINHSGQRSFKQLVIRDEATARHKIGDRHVDQMKGRMR